MCAQNSGNRLNCRIILTFTPQTRRGRANIPNIPFIPVFGGVPPWEGERRAVYSSLHPPHMAHHPRCAITYRSCNRCLYGRAPARRWCAATSRPCRRALVCTQPHTLRVCNRLLVCNQPPPVHPSFPAMQPAACLYTPRMAHRPPARHSYRGCSHLPVTQPTVGGGVLDAPSVGLRTTCRAADIRIHTTRNPPVANPYTPGYTPGQNPAAGHSTRRRRGGMYTSTP